MRDSSQILQSLWEFASVFRDALVKCDRSSSHLSLREFPRGACADSSLLLIEALFDRGVKAAYMLGYKNRVSHVWARVGDVDVDITADQFDSRNAKVIVLQNSSWHMKFRPTRLEKSFRDYPPSLYRMAFESLHREIAKALYSYKLIIP